MPPTPSDEDGERLQFSGLSAQAFDDVPATGETCVYTVRGRVVGRGERAMAAEGVRHFAALKIEAVLAGVTRKIYEEGLDPTLFDEAPEPPVDEAGPDAAEFDGPSFSGGPQ